MTRAWSSSSSCNLLNREWDSLLLDVVFEILDMLLEPADHVRFAAVCKHHHSLAKDYNLAKQHTRQLPPILLIRDQQKTTLVSVSEGKIYDNVEPVQLPPSTWSCYSCGDGWLATVEECTKEGVIIELQNPLRNPSTSIRLPVLKRISFEKIILSGDPALNPDSYGGCDTGEIVSVNLDSNSYNVPEAKLLTRLKPFSPNIFGRGYLVESTNGDLLYIEKVQDITCWIHGFKVYKVAFSDGDGSVIEQLLETRSIGDEALFLDDNHAVSVSVSNFPKCQRNSIYYS
ncbi:hypothetical protein ACLB2K_033900 [Fragaria x ananassa]